MKIKESQKTPIDLTAEIIESLTQASGACSQLVHMQQHLGWSVIRDALELMKEGLAQEATAGIWGPRMAKGN